jgi:hypothetical protein
VALRWSGGGGALSSYGGSSFGDLRQSLFRVLLPHCATWSCLLVVGCSGQFQVVVGLWGASSTPVELVRSWVNSGPTLLLSFSAPIQRSLRNSRSCSFFVSLCGCVDRSCKLDSTSCTFSPLEDPINLMLGLPAFYLKKEEKEGVSSIFT